jgi:hypothetical protein
MVVNLDKKLNLFSEVGTIQSNKASLLAAGMICFLVLSSCDQLLSVNLLQKAGLGQQKTPSAAALQAMPVTQIDELSKAPTFFADLSSDPALKTAALASLGTQMQSSDPATKQDAAALSALIELKTTPAYDTVNGIFNALGSLDSSNLSTLDSTSVVDFVEKSLPPDAVASKTSFTATITALCVANTAYDALGASLATGTKGSIRPEDSVQGAIVAAYVSSVPGATPADKAEALWSAMNGDPSLLPAYTPPPTGSGSNLGNIITAAGLDLSKYGI